ncbi:MAG: DUF58 domain-containing protein [Rhodospirillales bacterium]
MKAKPGRSRSIRADSGASVPDRLLRAEALAAVLPPLLVQAERVAATVSQGVHGRRRVGDGEAFWQFRRYQPGDPVARIDWRRSAKSDRAYVRETEWEAAQSVWLWRDASASMHWHGARNLSTKLERAELLMLALAALLVRGGEHVALLGGGLGPSPGRSALQRLAVQLGRNDAAKSPGLPEFQPLPRDARLVLIGDFLSPPDDVRTAIAAFSRQGVRGHLLQILDPAEETLPFHGRVLFAGLEGEGEVLFGRTEAVRDAYLAAYVRHQEALRDIARGLGWTMLAHRTDHAPETALLALYLTLAGPSAR